MKKKINVFDYAGDIMKALDKGVLITTKADGKVDSMTLGWGTLGIDWSLPVFTAYIRKSRFTKEQLEKNPEFTVNVPYGAFDPKILGVCGSKSGRDMDKAKELGLTLVDPEVISVPAVKELPLTLECRVVCVEKQDTDTVHRTELFIVWNTFQVKIRDQTEYDQRKKHKKDLLSL